MRSRLGPALAVSAAIGLAGCTATNPDQTTKIVSVADGVDHDVDDGVRVRNLALVSGEAGGPATVVGTLENSRKEPVDVTLAVEQATVTAKVPALGALKLSADGKRTTIKPVQAQPGAMTDMSLSVSGGKSITVGAPVLDPSGYYEDVAPEGWTPTPTPTEEHDAEHEGGH